MMKLKKIKSIIKPLLILTISFGIAILLVGMIAYSNCEETKVFIDDLLGNPIVTHSLPQA